MRNRMRTGIVLMVLAHGLSGCSGADAITPSAPSPVATQAVAAAGRASWPSGYTLTGVSLFGLVSESTPSGPRPIPDAYVYCELCGEMTHTFAVTDANGFYIFSGDLSNGGGVWLSGTPTPLNVTKEGYQDPAGLPLLSQRSPTGTGWREVVINGDTRFDIELVRR